MVRVDDYYFTQGPVQMTQILQGRDRAKQITATYMTVRRIHNIIIS